MFMEQRKWNYREDSVEASVRLLALVATQINNSTVSIPPNLLQAPFSVTPSQVRISAAWFLSLTLSLSTTSLVLFFFGLLELLWTRNIAVAACITAAVGMLMLSLVATTALPAIQHAFAKDPHLRVHQCPYKSPQSWLCYRMGHTFLMLFNSLSTFHGPY
ncbi:hypothetical protein BDZ97DRAFT_1901696 [Flammula alnicola]|nr:hypothetical protein BDZ97DRAFT_1901696 [Flammula alnicola]